MMTGRIVTASCRHGNDEALADLVALVRAEYEEMPGLALTRPQLCRMFGIDPVTCAQVVKTLIDAGILTVTPKGSLIGRRSIM